jgi:Xaa-Pro aminopeptidase
VTPPVAGTVLTESTAAGAVGDDLVEYERRIAHAREIMRARGFDAIVAADVNIAPQPSYGRYLAGFFIPAYAGPVNVIAIVPLEGEPVVVVPPGLRRSFVNIATARSWIKTILEGTYVDDFAWEVRTRWGVMARDLGSPVAEALRALGLESARIAVAGTWAGIEETKAQLGGATFEPTLLTDSNKGQEDLLEALIAGNSAWEITKLELAQAAADSVVTEYISAAQAGATLREARLAAEAAAYNAGADDVLLFGTIGADPWAFWDMSVTADDRFLEGKMYFVEIARCTFSGLSVQTARTFVIGAADDAQNRLIDAATRSLQAMFDTVHVGCTGTDLWTAALAPVREAGFEPWAQFGHDKGRRLSSPTTLSLVPGDKNALYEGQSLVLHPCLVDKERGNSAMIADTIMVEGGRDWRLLGPRPLKYGLADWEPTE